MLEENLKLEQENRGLVAHNNTLKSTNESLKSENEKLTKLNDKLKIDADGAVKKLADINNLISEERLKWNTQKAEEEKDLLKRQGETRIILGQKNWVELEKGKLEQQRTEVLKREHETNDRDKNLDVKEKDLSDKSKKLDTDIATFGQDKKDFNGNLENLKELIIKAMDKWKI